MEKPSLALRAIRLFIPSRFHSANPAYAAKAVGMFDFPNGRISFFLTELGEPEENVLRIVVAEGKSEGPEAPVPGTNISATEIVIASDSRVFAFIWNRYVAYSVRNESFSQPEQGQPAFTGSFTERTTSAYLRFVAETTFAADMPLDYWMGSIRHWELICLNHVIDVVSATPPEIRLIDPREASSCRKLR